MGGGPPSDVPVLVSAPGAGKKNKMGMKDEDLHTLQLGLMGKNNTRLASHTTRKAAQAENTSSAIAESPSELGRARESRLSKPKQNSQTESGTTGQENDDVRVARVLSVSPQMRRSRRRAREWRAAHPTQRSRMDRSKLLRHQNQADVQDFATNEGDVWAPSNGTRTFVQSKEKLDKTPQGSSQLFRRVLSKDADKTDVNRRQVVRTDGSEDAMPATASSEPTKDPDLGDSYFNRMIQEHMQQSILGAAVLSEKYDNFKNLFMPRESAMGEPEEARASSVEPSQPDKNLRKSRPGWGLGETATKLNTKVIAAKVQTSKKSKDAAIKSTKASDVRNRRRIARPKRSSRVAEDPGYVAAQLKNVSYAESGEVSSFSPAKLDVEALDIPQPPVPSLSYGLDRVLFNPGVYQLQDPQSRVFNFDPYLQKIMPVVEFDFNALKEYKTSSKDDALASLAKQYQKRFVGSTSSMTSTLAHFHYLLSGFRGLNLKILSRGFPELADNFTQINRAPNSIFLRRKDGYYAIDADKQFDGANVLMLLGKSMEKLLTLQTSDYERYRKSDPREVSEEERTAPEAFQYTTMGDFLMRSQLDAYDPRLPGTGMFDLKTRAVLPIRMDSNDFEPMVGYEITSLRGRFESYEREFYDMMRSTMLKYMLQARMGRMSGIFAAYHNIERIFGFQYISIQEMDLAIHGQTHPRLGDGEFKASLKLMNEALIKATNKFPDQSLRVHFETVQQGTGDFKQPIMWIFAEPMEESEIERLQNTSKDKVAQFERNAMGFLREEGASQSPLTEQAEMSEPSRTFDASEREAKAAEGSHGETAPQSSSPPPTTEAADKERFPEAEAEKSPTVQHDIETAQDGEKHVTYQPSSRSESPVAAGEEPAIPRRPLFAAHLVCKSIVNGTPMSRPTNLSPTDKWEIEYSMQECEANAYIWALYEQTKARRKALFTKFRDEDEDLNNGEGKKMDPYIKFLRQLSERGRKHRGELDRLDAGRAPVVYGQPVPDRSVVEAQSGAVKEQIEEAADEMGQRRTCVDESSEEHGTVT